MKNYNFRISVLPDIKKKIKKKTFQLMLKNEEHPYDMFDKAIEYIRENAFDIFNLDDDEYFPFEIIRGKKVVLCDLEYEACHCCGGEVDIYGEYEDSEDYN